MNDQKTTASRALSWLVSSCLALGWVATSCAPQDEDHDRPEDEHEEDHVEGRVALTDQQLASAAIQVERAGPGEIEVRLTLPAVITSNADATTHVNPKVPGIVRSIHVHLGERVETGDLLCSIDSVELGTAVAEFVRTNAMVEAAQETLTKETVLFERRMETRERVLQGAIEVNQAIYDRETELRAKAVSTIRPLLDAERALQDARLAKEGGLTDLWAERDARLLALEVDLREKRILARSARYRLLALGITDEQLSDVDEGSSLVAGTYEIRSSRPGIVSGRHITAGEYVDSETKLYTIEDLSRVWVVASAFEKQLTAVRTGQRAYVLLNAFPGLELTGAVAVVGYEVDAVSRALGIRVELDNPELPDWPEEYPIRPGMFGRVELVISRHEARVALPESALVHEDSEEYVFVRIGPGEFQKRRVEVLGSGDVVEVLSGLEPGEEVAVTQTFLLKSIERQGELGGGHSH